MFRRASVRFRGSAGRRLVAILLVLATAICCVELSGHWDQTLNDANDEAGLVAVVLCVGAALSAATATLRIVQPAVGSRPHHDHPVVPATPRGALHTIVSGRRADAGPPVQLLRI